MSQKEIILRYNLIINKLRRRSATFEEIQDTLKKESEIQGQHLMISKRTFQRNINAILSIYNIDIQFNRPQGVYYIHYDEKEDINTRILEAFDTFNALSISDRLSKYIHFEKRKSRGTENLYNFLKAIERRKQVQFMHQKFSDGVPKKRHINPYAVKEFKNRWYVIGKDNSDEGLKSFGLDRLWDLSILNWKFGYPKDFNVQKHYEQCFGIIFPKDKEPEEVILSFTPLTGKYIKTMPLHASQEVLIENNKEYRIKVKLFVTHDFFMEILSHGKEVKVVAPDALKKRVNDSCKDR